MWCCHDCKNLDKSKKVMSDNNYCFRYGCKASENGYICFWLGSDSIQSQINTSLKNGGCSDFKDKQKIEQLTLL